MNKPDATKVPLETIRKQRDTTNKVKAVNHPGTERLLADILDNPADKALIEILKNSLADVTSALKSNANALHKDRHHPMPFAMCQSDECICNGNIINGAIAIVTKTNRLDEIDKELDESDYESDPDQLAHDPDLPAPSEIKLGGE